MNHQIFEGAIPNVDWLVPHMRGAGDQVKWVVILYLDGNRFETGLEVDAMEEPLAASKHPVHVST
jgi:hypothetical protein